MKNKKHIMLHGFGAFPINFKAIIERSRELNDPIEWSIICPTGHYVDMYKELLGDDSVLYVHTDMKNYLSQKNLLDQLSDYSGNIYRNIESEKRFTKHKKAQRQLKAAAAMYLSIKNFVQKRQPTHILFSQVEGLDGMTLFSVGQELGIPTLVPTHTRHLGETFLSPDVYESLPDGISISGADREKANEFLKNFRAGKTKAAMVPPEIVNSENEYYNYTTQPFLKRVSGLIKRLIIEPEMREPDVFRASILINFPIIAKTIWGIRGFINKKIYDVDDPKNLPKRFAYYPLQYSPESSINTPAPYFVDQTRAIDAIRFSLPSDMQLVVKEHPACIGLRPLGFMNRLQKKAGIVVAKYSLPSSEITKNASITFSVTGTAALEAYLNGQPGLTLGGAFFAEYFGGPTGVDSLKDRIKCALENPPTESQIIESLAKTYAASSPFVLGSVFDGDSPFSKYSLRKSNIHNFYDAIKRRINL